MSEAASGVNALKEHLLAPLRFIGHYLPKGPKLQLLNLSILFFVIHPEIRAVFGFVLPFIPDNVLYALTVDFPTPLAYVLAAVAISAALDGVISRYRFGEWRIPWPSMVAATGVCLLINGNGALGVWPFVALPFIMVGSKHLIRWRGRHLFNPNNLAACILILALWARVGVHDWGAAPQTVALMLLFGTIATIRVNRFMLAVWYLAFSWLAFFVVAQFQGWSLATVWAFAFSPVQVVIAFFAITDPATSPNGRVDQLLWGALIVLISVPMALAFRVEAPLFALLVAAPQRHFITFLVTGKWPPKQGAGPKKAPAPATTTATSAFVAGGDGK